MNDDTITDPTYPIIEDPDDWDPGALPVEPDEGPGPAGIPLDPEHQRLVNPEF